MAKFLLELSSLDIGFGGSLGGGEEIRVADDFLLTHILFLNTCARGGPGGSNITVRTLILSDRIFKSFHLCKALSTKCLEGLIHL
uniref:Uncharacterized protein n=1 Tax=Lepeophtheirus salmonis TaxID=72036 RepID=A0A0K2TAU4_LEPSM